MDWKQKLEALIAVAPQLAFKPALIEQLTAYLTPPHPPPALIPRLELMYCVALQNQRIADLKGYPTLDLHSRQVKHCIQELVEAMKVAGLQLPPSAFTSTV